MARMMSSSQAAGVFFAVIMMSGSALAQTNKGGGPDMFEPDPTPDQGPFLAGFDALDNADATVEHVRSIHTPGDVDWTLFATTYNYPTSWIAAEPNTKLFIQLCQDQCDGSATAALNLQVFNFDLIESPATAQPVYQVNTCPGLPIDEVDRQLPNFRDDETLFVRVSDCDATSSDVDYRIIFRREEVGIDLHKVTGSVTLLNDAGQPAPAPAYALIRSNYNDFTFANPADGSYAIGLLARDFQSSDEITDLELTVTLFGAPFEASQTQPVTGMAAATTQVINFQLNLFRNGFEGDD